MHKNIIDNGLIDSNNICINDLIIAQNTIDNDMELFALDKHFLLMSELHGIKIYKTR